mmetsp:Transcript_99823/g.320340  ORF Transcript_99823/g.320340 Transcript_99823/m.320340 type:complete len:98 (+) Transcript_99823:73-366(+)
MKCKAGWRCHACRWERWRCAVLCSQARDDEAPGQDVGANLFGDGLQKTGGIARALERLRSTAPVSEDAETRQRETLHGHLGSGSVQRMCARTRLAAC